MATKSPPTRQRLATFMRNHYPAYTLDCENPLPQSGPPVAMWVPRPSDDPNRTRIMMPTPVKPATVLTPGRTTLVTLTSRPADAQKVLHDLVHRLGIQVKHEKGDRTTPKQVVSIARSHSTTVENILRDAFGSVAVMRDFTATEMCTQACQRAKSTVDNCQCSCLGTGHAGGRGVASWTNGSVYAYHDFQRYCYVLKSEELLQYEREKMTGAFDDDLQPSLALA